MLVIADTIDHLGVKPGLIGTQAIVGSAAFNLLAVTSLAIYTTTDVKKIQDLGGFNTTIVASMLSYVWFLLVLVVISPGVVEIWEAVLTVGFFLGLIGLAYGIDRFSASRFTDLNNTKETDEENKKDVAKCALRAMASRYGTFNILEAARGNEPPKMTQD